MYKSFDQTSLSHVTKNPFERVFHSAGIIPVFAAPKERKAEPAIKVYPKAMVHFVEPEAMPSFTSFLESISTTAILAEEEQLIKSLLRQLKDNSYYE